jgi:hypothetical protein
MSSKIATTPCHVPFEDFGMSHAALTLAGFNANYFDAKSAVLEEPTLLRWRLELGCLPIGYSNALESAGIDPATLRAQAQQRGERFTPASRAKFADWSKKPRRMN